MKFEMEFWNGSYYFRGKFPDGVSFELKSKEDLTYTKWDEKYQLALKEHNEPAPQPNECQCPECKKTFVCPNRGMS